MKIITILLSLVTLASIAFAAPDSEPTMVLVAPTQTTTIKAEEIVTEKAEAPLWNVSFGKSQFERGDLVDYRGSGLTIELQRRFGQTFFVGASYTNYNTEYGNLTTYDNQGDPSYFHSRESLDVFTASIEAHPIRLELPENSEFFAAITGGLMTSAQEASPMNDYYYGTGIGLNYNNQIGIRADLKSNRDFRAFSSFALIGYY